MTHHEYRCSSVLAREDWPFYAIVMAAMRQADTGNAERLREAFPDTWDEFEARYNAPGGLLPGEKGLVLGERGIVLGEAP